MERPGDGGQEALETVAATGLMEILEDIEAIETVATIEAIETTASIWSIRTMALAETMENM